MSDLIDRQEMIDWDTIAYLSDIRAKYDCNDEEERRYYRACSKAIDALRHMPSAQSDPCEDAVSRRRLLSDLKELIVAWEKYPVMAEQLKGVETAIGYVEVIPSAQPEIIRCKDCRHNQDCDIQYDAQAGEEFYCGAAERRLDA